MVVDAGEDLVCPVCQKKFTRRDNLKSHYSNLHGEHRGPFRCSFCFKVTKNKMSLRAHMKNYHPNKLQRRNSAGNNNAANNSAGNDGSVGSAGNPYKLDDGPDGPGLGVGAGLTGLAGLPGMPLSSLP